MRITCKRKEAINSIKEIWEYDSDNYNEASIVYGNIVSKLDIKIDNDWEKLVKIVQILKS